MVEKPILVDSSFYIGRLRAGIDPLKELAPFAVNGDLAICPIIRCEVGRGIKHPKLLRTFQAFWDVMINVVMDHSLWAQTENLVWQLDRSGVVLPLTDVIIAACAQKLGAKVLTFDHDFDLIPGLVVRNNLDN